MCGIAGIVHLDGATIANLEGRLRFMSDLIAHRGPDGSGIWVDASGAAGLAHRRLSIIDLSSSGDQPMLGANRHALVHNGEIYNYIELRAALSGAWPFHSATDTEVILAQHAASRDAAPNAMRGMWAYALWDSDRRRLFASRDRFGIKPFYYAIIGRILYFASEIKALLPFLPDVATNPDAFAEYVVFQYGLGEQTLFEGVKQLPAAHNLIIENGKVRVERYWDVNYQHDLSMTPARAEVRLRELVDESLKLHLRSDVPVGAYVSGGVDSSLVALLSAEQSSQNRLFFHGKFTEFPGFDESRYAQEVANKAGGVLHQIDITSADFEANIGKVIYHLDQPVAGPGSFPQYMVSGLCARHVKVVLGGQGGDEVFGGYSRYMVAYLERALLSAIDDDGDPSVARLPLTALAPRLSLLKEYKPLIRTFFAEGLFEPLDARWWRVVNRANDLADEVDIDALPMQGVRERFGERFNRAGVNSAAHLDKMTRFDFEFLLPALLQVEDRMGMAHGLESRVPLLDHNIVEFAAALPPEIKFHGGETKYTLRHAFADKLPASVLSRRDKMGFPVPIKEWFGGELHDFVYDIFSSARAGQRPFLRTERVLAELEHMETFSRKVWGFLSLELWYQAFHDQAHQMRKRAAALCAET